MSVILKDIDYNKRKNNDYSKINSEMYSLDKYREIAKKCISLFSGANCSVFMIKNEDAISHVAEHIMWGHARWKEDGGRTLKSYLNQCAIWAIKVWKTKVYKSDSKSCLSLNHTICNNNGSESEQYKLVEDKKSKTPQEIIFNNPSNEAISIINKCSLTKLQNKCVSLRYIEGKKLQEIADEIGVSKQAVNQHIKKAINKLRNQNGICE